MYMFGQLGSDPLTNSNANLVAGDMGDFEPADRTLYLVEVPQGWELRSSHGHGILYQDLSRPLRLAQGWIEAGRDHVLITRSASA